MPMPPGNITGDPNFWPIFRSTQYIDKDGSPEGSLFFDRGQYLRQVYVAHETSDQAVLDFCGTQSIITNGDTGYRAISRTIPHAWPKKPWMLVQGVSQITPMVQVSKTPNGPILTLADVQGRDTDDTPLYYLAELSLNYAMPTYYVYPDSNIFVSDPTSPMYTLPDEGQAVASGHLGSRYITWFIKPMSKMLTIPRGLLKTSDNKTVLESIGINEHVAEYHYTWHQVPEAGLPKDQWVLGANTVNDTTFDGRPPGTLLFTGEPEIRMSANPITGQLLYDVTYRFHSLLIPDPPDPGTPTVTKPPKGWNYIRKPTLGGLGPLIFSLLGKAVPLQSELLFPDFDFRKLFRPDPLEP